MRHLTARLPEELLARIDELRRRLDAERGRRPRLSRSGVIVELLEIGAAIREHQLATGRGRSAPTNRRRRSPAPPTRPATTAPTPSTPPRPRSAAVPSDDTARIARAQAGFREAVESGGLQPGDWHDYVKRAAPEMKNGAILAWYNAQRLPTRDPDAARRLLMIVEAWLGDGGTDDERSSTS